MEQRNDLRYGRILDYLSRKSRKMNIPSSGTFELTPLCNMNCKMCYIRMTKEEMEKVGSELSADEWIRIAEEAVAAGMTMLLFTGGEAILYKEFKKVYLAVRKMGLFISINTNGTVLTDSWIEFFKKYPPAKFNITLYGGSNETYNKLCGNPKGFDQVKAAIEKLQKNNLQVLLNCTITKQNAHDISNIFAFAKEHDLEVHATTYNFPPVRKEGVEDLEVCRFTAKEAARAKIDMVWNLWGEEQFRRNVQIISQDYKELKNPEDNCTEIIGDKVLCAAGRANFWMTWDGRMLPCGMIPDYSVSIKGKSFVQVWKEVVEHTSKITLAPECKNCPKKNLCSPCAAKLKSETGEYCLKADYMCEYVDEYIRLMGEAKKYLENE